MVSTPLPPPDGGNDHAFTVARPPSGDAERVASDLLENVQMSCELPLEGLQPAAIDAPTSSAAPTPEIAHETPPGRAPEPAGEPQPPPPGMSESPGIPPLAGTLDAAVKLVADANVAAEALENLRRLLEKELPGAARGPAGAAPSRDAEAWSALAASCASQPPLPLAGDDAGRADLAPEHDPELPPSSLPSLPTERARLDVRGFFAGFALSCAVGVVLYLFIAAG